MMQVKAPDDPFLPTVGPNGDSRATRAHWLHPRGRDRVVTHEQSGRCEPTRSKQNIRERWPEAEKRPSSLNSLAIRTPEPARTAERQQSKPTTRRHKGADYRKTTAPETCCERF